MDKITNQTNRDSRAVSAILCTELNVQNQEITVDLAGIRRTSGSEIFVHRLSRGSITALTRLCGSLDLAGAIALSESVIELQIEHAPKGVA
ncbi:hypothetical protein N7535_001194 [Penicillium sp. DV-2018c]|nr:hypothetical protein N7535_001194 [Penicillium sp. DV-2018c]